MNYNKSNNLKYNQYGGVHTDNINIKSPFFISIQINKYADNITFKSRTDKRLFKLNDDIDIKNKYIEYNIYTKITDQSYSNTIYSKKINSNSKLLHSRNIINNIPTYRYSINYLKNLRDLNNKDTIITRILTIMTYIKWFYSIDGMNWLSLEFLDSNNKKLILDNINEFLTTCLNKDTFEKLLYFDDKNIQLELKRPNNKLPLNEDPNKYTFESWEKRKTDGYSRPPSATPAGPPARPSEGSSARSSARLGPGGDIDVDALATMRGVGAVPEGDVGEGEEEDYEGSVVDSDEGDEDEEEYVGDGLVVSGASFRLQKGGAPPSETHTESKKLKVKAKLIPSLSSHPKKDSKDHDSDSVASSEDHISNFSDGSTNDNNTTEEAHHLNLDLCSNKDFKIDLKRIISETEYINTDSEDTTHNKKKFRLDSLKYWYNLNLCKELNNLTNNPNVEGCKTSKHVFKYVNITDVLNISYFREILGFLIPYIYDSIVTNITNLKKFLINTPDYYNSNELFKVIKPEKNYKFPKNLNTCDKSTVNFDDDVLIHYNKKIKRFDEGILYFSVEGDQRVRLLLDTLCASNNDFCNINLNISKSINMSNLNKESFIDKMSEVSSNIHYEWNLFIYYIAVFLQKYNESIPDEYKKLLYKLENVSTPTTHIIKGIFDKIASFKVKDSNEEKHFIKDSHLLSKLETIKFKSTLDIYNLFLGTRNNSYESLLYSLLYITESSEIEDIKRYEYKLKLEETSIYKQKIINSINNVTNIILMLNDILGEDIVSVFEANKKTSPNYNYYLVYYDYYLNSIMEMIIFLFKNIDKNTSETYIIYKKIVSLFGLRDTDSEDTIKSNSTIIEKIKRYIENVLNNPNDFMTLKNIPLCEYCIISIIEIFKFDDIIDTIDNDSSNTLTCAIIRKYINMSFITAGIEFKKAHPVTCAFIKNDFIICPFDENKDTEFYTQIKLLTKKLASIIIDYNNIIDDANNTNTYNTLKEKEEKYFNVFCYIVQIYKSKITDNFNNYPEKHKHIDNIFNFGIVNTYDNGLNDYEIIKTVYDEPGGIKNLSNPFENNSMQKLDIIKNILDYNDNIRDVPLHKVGTNVYKYTKFICIIDSLQSCANYNKHTSLIKILETKNFALPYIKNILDNRIASYDTKLSDNLSLYLNIIYKYSKEFKYFGYNYDKLFMHSLIEKSTEAPDNITKEQPYYEINEFSTIGKYNLNRDKIYNKNGTLMCLDANRNEIDIGVKSELFKRKMIDVPSTNNKCSGTGFIDGVKKIDGKDVKLVCNDFINRCLNGTGIKSCKLFLQDEKFWLNAADEVKIMFPAIMVSTLQAFGFHRVTRLDAISKKMLVFSQTVDEWLQHLYELTQVSTEQRVLEVFEFKLISNNLQIRYYLTNIIVRINDNPSILNPSYTETAEMAAERNTPIFSSPLGIPVYNPTNVGIFKYIAYKQISNNNTIQKGGSPIVNPSITTTYTAALNPLASKRESGTYKALYQMLLIKMKESNKDLDDDDKKNIAILLNKFEVEENRMIFILKTFVNYVRYLAKHPHDKTPETHTHNKLTTLKPQPIMQQPYIIPGVTFNRRKYMEELNMIQTDITVRSGILLKTHNELFEKLQVYINPNTIRNPLNVLQQQLLPVANIVNPVIVRKQVIGPQVIKQVKRVVELVPTDPFQSSLDMAPSPFYQPSMVNPSVDSDKWIIR